MEITDELVAHIARLSRLALAEDEARGMKVHFEKILRFVADLEELDLEGVDPTPYAPGEADVTRADEPRPSQPLEETLRIAPAARPPFFLVPRIVGDPGAGGES